jgi:hypothetical protein
MLFLSSSRKEAVEIFSMDGSKKFQNLIGRLDASEKRSFYSSKSFFPTNKQGEQTDVIIIFLTSYEHFVFSE